MFKYSQHPVLKQPFFSSCDRWSFMPIQNNRKITIRDWIIKCTYNSSVNKYKRSIQNPLLFIT
jgi:hypothetical protein